VTPRDRRAVALGLAVVLAALGGVWVVRPYVAALGELRQEIGRERELLAREQALLREAPALDGRLVTLNSALARTGGRLFPGADELAATAALASYVGDVARRQRVWFQQGETRPPVGLAGGLVAIEVGVRAAGDLEGILGLLSELEAGPRLVQVTRLGIERTAGPIGPEPDRETLAIGMVIRGVAAPAPPEGAP